MRLVTGLCALLITSFGAAAHDFRIGSFAVAIEGLSDPRGVDVDDGGTIYVAEATGPWIGVYGRDGRWIGRLQDANLVEPRAVAVAGGEVFVTDEGADAVLVFSSDGRLLRRWGGTGVEAGRFHGPCGVFIGEGSVLVADRDNDRVQVFDLAGNHVRTIGSRGDGDGHLRAPEDVAVDGAGNIVVLDTGNSRIQVFAPDGSFVRGFGEWGPFPGLLDGPLSIEIVDDHYFVADMRNHRIHRFAADGAEATVWGEHEMRLHEAEGKLHYPESFRVAPDRSFAVVAETVEDRLQIFDRLAEGETQPPPPPPVNRGAVTHFGSHVSVDDRLMTIADPERHEVIVFDMQHEVPILINRFGERGEGYGLMGHIAGLDVDQGRRRVLVGDTLTERLCEWHVKFDPEGRLRFDPLLTDFWRSFDLAWLTAHLDDPPQWTIEAAAITSDPDGNVYLVDTRNDRIWVFDDDLQFTHAWGGRGAGPGELHGPTDAAVSADGSTVYVVDQHNHRVQAFAPDGTFRFAFGQRGRNDGAFERPWGVCAARDGSVYVTDAVTCRVQRFTADGVFVSAWGAKGGEMEELWKPRGIAEDATGRIIVVDHGNQRGKIYGPDGAWLVTFGTGNAYTPQNRPRRREGE